MLAELPLTGLFFGTFAGQVMERTRSRVVMTSRPEYGAPLLRFLHTSDWHLGRTFGPVSLADDQAAFLDWLVVECAQRQVDLVVIAGDIYDRAIMPTEAAELFLDTLRRLRATGALVAAITGNHDGAVRVAGYDDLLDSSGVYLRGGYAHAGEVLHLEMTDGPLDLVLLPFLDPQAAPDDLDDSTVADGDDVVQRRVARTHQSVLSAAAGAARAALTAPRSLAVAHAFVAGSSTTESERQLTVGGTGQVDASVFDGFSYTALGHLHRPQSVSDSVRYSGTPLAYSFSEEHAKSVIIVDMAPDGLIMSTIVPVPGSVGRPVRTVIGTMAELLAHPADERAFVRAVVTDRDTVLDAKARLAVVFPRVVEVKLEPAGVTVVDPESACSARELPPLEATRSFWLHAEGSDLDERTGTLLQEIVGVAVATVTV